MKSFNAEMQILTGPPKETSSRTQQNPFKQMTGVLMMKRIIKI
jgi:hypothetical protein